MAIKTSLGFAIHVNTVGSLLSAMDVAGDGMAVDIFTGTAPAPEAAATGTKLIRYTNAGGATGLTLESVAGTRRVRKPSGETWSGTTLATGDAGYYRIVRIGDTNGASDSAQRIQGVCSSDIALADMYLPSVAFTSGAVRTIADYSLELPNPV